MVACGRASILECTYVFNPASVGIGDRHVFTGFQVHIGIEVSIGGQVYTFTHVFTGFQVYITGGQVYTFLQVPVGYQVSTGFQAFIFFGDGLYLTGPRACTGITTSSGSGFTGFFTNGHVYTGFQVFIGFEVSFVGSQVYAGFRFFTCSLCVQAFAFTQVFFGDGLHFTGLLACTGITTSSGNGYTGFFTNGHVDTVFQAVFGFEVSQVFVVDFLVPFGGRHGYGSQLRDYPLRQEGVLRLRVFSGEDYQHYAADGLTPFSLTSFAYGLPFGYLEGNGVQDGDPAVRYVQWPRLH